MPRPCVKGSTSTRADETCCCAPCTTPQGRNPRQRQEKRRSDAYLPLPAHDLAIFQIARRTGGSEEQDRRASALHGRSRQPVVSLSAAHARWWGARAGRSGEGETERRTFFFAACQGAIFLKIVSNAVQQNQAFGGHTHLLLLLRGTAAVSSRSARRVLCLALS